MAAYRVIFNGYGANKSIYREQEISIETPLSWSRNTADSEDLMFLVHKRIKEHFNKYDILLIEKVG